MARKLRKKNKTARPGRPIGAATAVPPVVVAVAARCPRCAGTEYKRVKGYRPQVREAAGVSRITGKPYTHIVRRRVICKCGQHFIERSEQNFDPNSGTPASADNPF